MIIAGLSSIYFLTAGGLAFYGALGLITIWFYIQHRHESYPCPTVNEADLPHVTVQLPIYNERFVVERLISAAAGLDYPRERLQIQVIDDSTDNTSDIVKTIVNENLKKGINIEHIRREHRSGFKAGAL